MIHLIQKKWKKSYLNFRQREMLTASPKKCLLDIISMINIIHHLYRTKRPNFFLWLIKFTCRSIINFIHHLYRIKRPKFRIFQFISHRASKIIVFFLLINSNKFTFLSSCKVLNENLWVTIQKSEIFTFISKKFLIAILSLFYALYWPILL